jgi:hypothetical protein
VRHEGTDKALFKIFGIQIGLHYSWLLIAVLIVLSLAGQFTETNPQWGVNIIWGVSILTALLFFRDDRHS